MGRNRKLQSLGEEQSGGGLGIAGKEKSGAEIQQKEAKSEQER